MVVVAVRVVEGVEVKVGVGDRNWVGEPVGVDVGVKLAEVTAVAVDEPAGVEVLEGVGVEVAVWLGISVGWVGTGVGLAAISKVAARASWL